MRNTDFSIRGLEQSGHVTEAKSQLAMKTLILLAIIAGAVFLMFN